MIIRPDAATEYYTDERCWILESANRADDPAVSIARARVEPGVITQWHALDGITERYVIIEGNGAMEVGDTTEAVAPGDVIIIPPEVRQRITNTGSGDLIFYCVCTPRFVPEAYRALE